MSERRLRRFVEKLLPLADLLVAPFVYPCAWLLKGIRRAGVDKLPLCRSALMRVGVFPVRDHYYEPQFDHRKARRPFSQERPLPGIDWNVDEQLALLAKLSCAHEIADLPRAKTGALEFHLDNETFESGDAEYWYQLIRWLKPRRIFEVGGGNSTLMAIRALRKNREENPGYRCRHVCIEPYEMPWLEQAGVEVVRRKVEELGVGFFSELGEGDLLFIDTSHAVRPVGDVTHLYLEVLPRIKPGVVIHIHDIYFPYSFQRDLLDGLFQSSETPLLQALLTNNDRLEILFCLSMLHYDAQDVMKDVFPEYSPAPDVNGLNLPNTSGHFPSSIYLRARG